MKRILSHVVSLLAAGMVVSAVVPACAENDQTIFIVNVQAPPAARANGVCTYLPDPAAAFLTSGVLDIGVADSYTGFVLVGNQLLARGDQLNNRAESNRVRLNGGIIRISEANGSPIREFTSFASGFINPGANNVAEFGLIGVILLDQPTKDLLLLQSAPTGGQLLANRGIRKTILINVKIFGTTLGGTEVESGEYQFPTEVCNGCLVDFSSGNDETAMVQPNCNRPLGATTGMNATVTPCRPGQDETTPCQLCKGKRNIDGKTPCDGL